MSLGLLLRPGVALGQGNSTNHDPDAAQLITSDIPKFWRVFDRASLTDASDLFQQVYLDAGSPGLRDFTRLQIKNGRALASVVADRPRYYAAIRKSTLALDATPSAKGAIRNVFHAMKALYPEAVFPDVYFVIGNFSAAGTFSENGLLIGVEMNARDPQTPVDELSAAWRAVTGQITDLPYIVGHELVHAQQPSHDAPSQTLLTRALREGSADFIGELISGGFTTRIQHSYGDAHERQLWAEFRGEMHGTDVRHWLFGGDRFGDRPTDLGYYIGYKICEAFYRRTADKSEAVRQIIEISDSDAFLRLSGYSGD